MAHGTAPSLDEANSKFERLQAEDSVVLLNQLCTTCVRFMETSQLLRKFSRREKIKHGDEELNNLGSAERLRAAYLDGCHLCTLFWQNGIEETSLKYKLDSIQVQVQLEAVARTADGEAEVPNRLPFMVFKLNRGGNYLSRELGPNLDRMTMEAYLETNPNLNQNLLGNLMEPISSKSDLKLSQILDWYCQCTERHTKCTGFPSMVTPSQLPPARLLDLRNDKPRLECEVRDIPNLRYATLSHVWGNDPASYLQLKQATLETFKTEIPLDAMPSKYVDAIRITKTLRLSYIWIDSLCIIQDCTKDWTAEALKMAAIYGHSACNISYTHEPSEEPSKRYLRDPRAIIPCKLTAASARPSRLAALGIGRLRNRTLPPAAVVVQQFAGALHASWSTEAYKRKCSLLSRAWVFQERLLCPRTIYYGNDRLLWECCETFIDEFSGPLPYVPRSKAQIYTAFSGATQRQAFNNEWKLMVSEYRSCKLSFENDRAVAFAGIARAAQHRTGMTYLAGIWKETAHLDLLWCVIPKDTKIAPGFPRLETPTNAKAPSWSWFSVPCQLTADYDTVDYSLSTLASWWEETVYHASVLSFKHPRFPTEPEALLYDFGELRVMLSTHKIPARLRWENGAVQLMPHGHPMLPKALHPLHDPRTAMQCNLDDLSLRDTEELPENTSMVLLVFNARHENRKGPKRFHLNIKYPVPEDNKEASNWWTLYQFSGLIIVPEKDSLGQEDNWKRIGAYTFSVRGPASLAEVMMPFDLESQQPDEVWLN
ncbi:hypothetical protein QQS21_003846 [Conoideocrella luteorostrata]|uniref:Heterokaryon incompatibility domain-containing protein n=1 Tax=Conoideocrella luteorostrata TaxID=1105319 RepID=A0AAJ0CVL5_9HYPO|nr:hypothetical protein QQS21_003846 [Conoideocrella luteorostrata]